MKPATFLQRIVIAFVLTLTFNSLFSQTTLIPYTQSWKYLNDGSNQGTAWYGVGFSDVAWPGPSAAPFQFNEALGGTTLGANPTTTYFRTTFSVSAASLAAFGSVELSLVCDDAAVVYVNGVERARTNITGTPPAFNQAATSAINGGTEGTPTVFSLSTSYFNASPAVNTIAVEVHQASSGPNDMRFQLQLLGLAPPAVTIDRGPYIMMVNETEATIRWRTTVASNSRVQLGTSAGSYSLITDDAASVTQHIVRVTGLTPDTRYYYSVGTTANPTIGGDAADYYFTTAPQQSTTRKLKFAVFGDCGRNDNSFRTQSISSYQNYVGSNTADALLLLGDNAYNSGLESEYNTGFFQPMSGTMLKNHALFPAPGNHDYYGTSQSSRSGEYYQAFTMPTNAECGGVASGTKAYYSWNWGDVHFLSLDSYGTETASNLRLYDTTGPQVTWIKNDLAANTRKWVVAYWHHPPYTMGSHTSNTETELINIRFNFIRILERLGVDMILCGHSHDYERSRLLNGHYGTEVATASMTPYLVSNSTGFYDGSANSCPYTTVSGTANHGTVYVVAGSSGADGGVNAGIDGYPHNALPHSIDDGGMFYFEVDGNRLDAKFLRRNNTVGDQFTIMKDVNQNNTYNISNGNSITLTASWPGSYSWNTSATTQSITVTPPLGSTNYTVTDQFGCITDQFTVNANSTLPVLMTDYRVALRNEKVYVNWTTAAEANNERFTIERSKDARHFEIIGVVNGAGNSTADISYEYIDLQPYDGISYYRLSQVNTDGVVKYYDTRRIVNNKNSDFYADAYKSGKETVTMQVYSSKAEKIQLRVTDISGRIVRSEAWFLNAGSNTKTIDLKNGSYILEWRRADGKVLNQKIIVQ